MNSLKIVIHVQLKQTVPGSNLFTFYRIATRFSWTHFDFTDFLCLQFWSTFSTKRQNLMIWRKKATRITQFRYIANRYQIEFNTLRSHKFYGHQFCWISVNFFEKTPNFNDLVKKSQSDHEISLVIRFWRVRTWNSLKKRQNLMIWRKKATRRTKFHYIIKSKQMQTWNSRMNLIHWITKVYYRVSWWCLSSAFYALEIALNAIQLLK